MKFDLRKIMKRAWEIKKEADRKTKNSKWNRNDFSELKSEEKSVFGICLEMAWEEVKKVVVETAKSGNTIKEWFMKEKFGKEVENFSNTIEILKETKKAVYGTVYYSSGMSMEIWVPKSCLS